MRLIDCNETLRKVEQIPFIANENKAFHEGCRYMQKKVLRIFHESKSVDAVEVVRCENCRFWDNEHISSEGLAKCVTGESGIRYRRSYDFCSCGVRKEVTTW